MDNSCVKFVNPQLYFHKLHLFTFIYFYENYITSENWINIEKKCDLLRNFI